MEWLIDRRSPDTDTQRHERDGCDVYDLFGALAERRLLDCGLWHIYRLFIR